MITRIFLAGLAVSSLAMAYSGDSFAAKFEAMPPAVQKTATANMLNALPISIGSVQRESGWEYQVNTRLNGEYHNILVDEKGKLLAVKDGTDLASIPAVVKSAIQKESLAAEILTLEKVTEGGLISYGAVIQDDAPGKYIRILVAADGTLKTKKSQNTDR